MQFAKRSFAALILTAATACQLLPGAAPTPFPIEGPTSLPLSPPPPTELTATPLADTIVQENVSDLRQIGILQEGLAGELAWAPDGSMLAVTTIHGVGLFDSVTLLKKTRLDSDVTPLSLAFSPDGALLVTGGQDLPESEQDTVTIWDLPSSTRRHTLIGHTDWVNSVGFSPTGEFVASGSDDGTTRLWRVDVGAEAIVLRGHTRPVTSVTFSPDGEILATGSLDGLVRLWRVSDGAFIGELRNEAPSVRSVAFSPDGVTLAAASIDGTIRLWAAGTGTLLHSLSGHAGSVDRVTFSPDGALLASAGFDQTVRIWSAADGTLLQSLSGHTGPVISVAFSPDGKQLASGSLDGTVRLWGLTEPRVTVYTPEPLGEPIARLTPGTPLVIREIHMLTDSLGWAIGGDGPHVLRTEDGGVTWIDTTPPERADPPTETPRSATGFFLDPYVGWVVYYPPTFVGGPQTIDALSAWRTSDGVNWQPGALAAPMDLNEGPPLITFADEDHGWMLVEFGVGAGQHGYTLVRTEDGGFNWESARVPPDTLSPCHKTGIAFADPLIGWMTNECPFELGGGVFVDRTEDGGNTWLQIELAPPAGKRAFAETSTLCRTHSPNLQSGSQGAVVVECNRQAGGPVSYLYTTEDGGRTWTTSVYPGGELLLLNPTTGWALSREIHKTEDGGRSWRLIKTVSWDGQFSFVSAELAWAVARNRAEIALVRSNNGGRTWQVIEPTVAP